ncbi:nucleotidyl transferase AbiEii/AbiGii toxin family protein [Agrobacterium rubi]|nr:nucleotidyl transferase AbiEii/AbiGii toxin family protein [Agrobacterium rubi]NTF24547.1 nucleotidyl transferase AbiEii/AbiGii toxin family protein [Agrobacterium rubi]
MKSDHTGNPRGLAVSDKLRSAAKAAGEDTHLVQMRFAQERLLARLQSGPYRNRFLLKGGLMFSCTNSGSSRPTEDIDLHDKTGVGLQNMAKAIHESAGTDLDDGVVYDLSSFKATPIREAGSPGVRVVMNAYIGRSRVHVKMDMCTGDPITPEPVTRTLPSALPKEFPPVAFKSYPWETALAEKIHAVTKFGLDSTRMKDWYDIAAIGQQEEVDGLALCNAIRNTFDWRGDVDVDPLPEGLSEGFVEEKSHDYFRHVSNFDPPESRATLELAILTCRDLMLPALEAVHEGRLLDCTWSPDGGWGESFGLRR